MNRIAIPWSGRALVIREDAPSTHPEPAEARGRTGGGAQERGEGPRGSLTEWFTESELSIVESFPRQKRRDEWILSRVAAKQLAVDCGLCAHPRECAIVDRRIGSSYVSLSHSAPYAAAAIDDKPVGIDVQVVRDLSERSAHLFLSESEIEEMQTCTLPHRLLHFFCAKEAAWKRAEGAIETLRRVPLRLLAATDTALQFEGVETVGVNDVIVALTL